jgi:hypothetical protein
MPFLDMYSKISSKFNQSMVYFKNSILKLVKIAGLICTFFLLCLCKKHENSIAVEPKQKNKQSVT